ncbi:PrsW family glutamic-type intramembrane protease [Novipirellula sp. SH528]|uniref:PrsW family glutamic-type intramembrane protease n=1 Tax=Novipirellula sp. SH528 TaxID=3454466 RepID=UPI003FA024A1
MILIFSGFASFVLALVLSRILMPVEAFAAGDPGSVRTGLASAFLGAALPEELARIMVSICTIAAVRNVAGREVVVTCGMIGLGFALFENMLYALTTASGVELIVERAAPTVSHGATALIMGAFLERAISSGRRRRIGLFLLTLAVPCLLHGLYDFGAFVLEVCEFPDIPDEPNLADLKPLVAILAPMLLISSVGLVELIWGGRIVYGLRKQAGSR